MRRTIPHPLINPSFGRVPFAAKISSSYQDRIRKRNTSKLRVVSILSPRTGGPPQWNKDKDTVDQEQCRETMSLMELENP